MSRRILDMFAVFTLVGFTGAFARCAERLLSLEDLVARHTARIIDSLSGGLGYLTHVFSEAEINKALLVRWAFASPHFKPLAT